MGNSPEQPVTSRALEKDILPPKEPWTQAILEALPIGLAILDPQTRLIYSNQRYSDLRGIPSDLAAWVQAIHPEDRERVLRSRSRSLLYYEPWAETYRFVHSDGTNVWVSARAVPLRVGSNIVGFVVTLEDVTPIKTAEERLHRANEELQMHAGRLEQEVQHRMAKADEALYELERLGYSIVHDMRAPLRTVQSYAQILLEEYSDQLEGQAKAMLGRMSEATHRQDRLIQDVLSYHSYVREEYGRSGSTDIGNLPAIPAAESENRNPWSTGLGVGP